VSGTEVGSRGLDRLDQRGGDVPQAGRRREYGPAIPVSDGSSQEAPQSALRRVRFVSPCPSPESVSRARKHPRCCHLLRSKRVAPVGGAGCTSRPDRPCCAQRGAVRGPRCCRRRRSDRRTPECRRMAYGQGDRARPATAFPRIKLWKSLADVAWRGAEPCNSYPLVRLRAVPGGLDRLDRRAGASADLPRGLDRRDWRVGASKGCAAGSRQARPACAGARGPVNAESRLSEDRRDSGSDSAGYGSRRVGPRNR
jgi:hypothetical protein